MTSRGELLDTSQYTEYRPLMFSIAYRMTGSVSDAEDIVQEAFLRADKASKAKAKAETKVEPETKAETETEAETEIKVESPKSYLATITTRLAIDHLRSARVRRESYIGTWLPEPLIGAEHPGAGAGIATGAGARAGTGRGTATGTLLTGTAEPDPAELAETSDSLSMAFLVLLESLAPAERAVFLLREVFGYDYSEIAGITGKTEAACRQIFARARRRIDEGRPRFETSRAEGEELTALFLAAADGGDMTSLLERLAPDVLFYGDSGGKGEATFIAPLAGRDLVGQILRVQIERTLQLGAELTSAWVNGQPGLLARDPDGGLIAVVAFEMLDGQIQAIRAVANPEKLRHIGPISHTWHQRWREQQGDDQNDDT
jgi:RNA polymerase sigma-70 factor (ECF subfamily)